MGPEQSLPFMASLMRPISQQEKAKMTNFTHLKQERRVLEEDSYVDDIQISHNDLEGLNNITKGVEEIPKSVGMSLKPWVGSG